MNCEHLRSAGKDIARERNGNGTPSCTWREEDLD
jgi:hypothetical protein